MLAIAASIEVRCPMPESRNDYGPVNRIAAEAFGEPGQRTFRLFTANEGEAASLWMEKFQLAQLGSAIGEQLNRVKALRSAEAPTPDAARAYAGDPALEFRVAQMALGFDDRRGLFLLLAYAAEDVEESGSESRPTFSCQATPDQLRALAEQIEEVVAAGRPLCPLCGEPIDRAGHHCIRSNGHSKQPVPPLLEEDEEE
jgi:uncharacterized repeat protein (TIGR03847 family)